MDEKLVVHALVTALRHDMSRGLNREELLRSLSSVITRDLMEKVRERV